MDFLVLQNVSHLQAQAAFCAEAIFDSDLFLSCAVKLSLRALGSRMHGAAKIPRLHTHLCLSKCVLTFKPVTGEVNKCGHLNESY